MSESLMRGEDESKKISFFFSFRKAAVLFTAKGVKGVCRWQICHLRKQLIRFVGFFPPSEDFTDSFVNR